MFWSLLLAHFLADYPLQSNQMARSKRNLGMLLLHIGIHLGVMVVLVAGSVIQTWPYLLLLAALHFSIELGKLAVQRTRPNWVVVPYLADQAVHVATIALVTFLAEARLGVIALPLSRTWAVYLIAYLLATHVWWITEGVLAHGDALYRQEVMAQGWSRMAARALFLSLFLWAASLFPPLVGAAAALRLPYLKNKYALRALLTDLAVAFGGLTFIAWNIR
jgi:hypothetical protein